MTSFLPYEVAITGITYFPKWYSGPLKSIKHTHKIRGDLALYTAKFAGSIGYNLVIVDGGSAKTFVSLLKKIPGAKIFQVKIHKRSPNRRKAILESSRIDGVRAIVMTEIEKVSLITDCLNDVVDPVFSENIDIVIPKREPSLFQKFYPTYMYESEAEGNLLYNEELRSYGILSPHEPELDLFFGVRVYKNDNVMLKKIFSKYESTTFDTLIGHKLFDLEEYSDSQFFPVIKALTLGYRVKSVEIPFKYPEKQKENEEKGDREAFISKRRFQRLTILIELMHFLGYMERKKTRKIHRSI